MSVRVAAVAGVVSFVLIVIHSQLRSGVPAATYPGREVLGYLARHHDRLQLGAVAVAFAMLAALVWLSGLLQVLRSADDRTPVAAFTALGGGVLAAASTVVGALIEGTTATRFAELDAGEARVLWTMFLLSTGATRLGLALVVGATAVVSLRTQLFARWFTVTSVVLALLSLVGAFTIGYGSDPIQAIAGVTVLLDSIWILIVSIFILRGPRSAVE